MARQIRKKSGTGIYHVMLRGINRQDIFEDDEDYLQMVSILRGQSERYDEKGLRLSSFCIFYAYCLMSTHRDIGTDPCFDNETRTRHLFMEIK